MAGKATYNELGQRVKELEKQVIEQSVIRETLSLIVGTINATIWFWNIKTNEVTTDPRFVDVLGYDPGELKETLDGFKRFHRPDEWEEIRSLMDAHVRGETPFYIHENRLLTKSGEWKWILNRGRVAFWDEEGNPELFIATVIDITERKQAEEELRRHRDHLEALVKERTSELEMVNEQLKALLNATSDSAVLHDTEGKVVALNTVAAGRTDLGMEQCLGKNAYEIFTPSFGKSRNEKAVRVFSSGKPCRFQEDHGETILDTSIYPVLDGQGNVVQLAVYAKDITKEVEVYKELRKREKELEIKTSDLERTNAALTVLLKKREEDKTELEEKVLANMKELVEPYVEELKNSGLNPNQKSYLNILTTNLEE
ncbi:MAG: PAS domain S-box protein, partial [Deltaproteobacteria bacterium]|nr:PAS domain S-box protein [Deltaproteobacteria bacterium]